MCKGGQSAEYYVEAANLKEKTNAACTNNFKNRMCKILINGKIITYSKQ